MERHLRRAVERFAWILLPIWSGFLISGMNGLKQTDVNLVVPSVILQGETLVMDCRFPSNESGMVDSVKWYKGSREFFRYSPKIYPKAKLIPIGNLVVDLNQSDMNKVVVRDVPAWFRGNITCEVTTEPTFKTVTKISYLQVAVPPEQDPDLKVEVIRKNPHENNTSIGLATWQQGLRVKNDSLDSNIVNLGDTILATCTSGPSTPAVDLTFRINDESTELYRGVSLGEELRENADDKSVIKIAKMNLTIQPDTLKLFTRTVHIKCVAKLFHLYNAASKDVIKELPRESSATASSYANSSQRLCFGSRAANEVLLMLTGIFVWFFNS